MTPKTIAVGNLKGGVGKTSIVLAMADSLAQGGKRVLVCDLDPQGSASIVLGVELEPDQLTAYDLLKGGITGSIGQAITSTSWHENLHVVPADNQLARFSDESITAAEHRLQVTMMDSPELDGYDVVLLDLPPSLGRLTLNGLMAADAALAITTPEALAVAGVAEYLAAVESVKLPVLNPHLEIGGIIINMVDSRLNEHKFQIDQITQTWPDLTLGPIIPARAAIKDMASTRQPIRNTGNRDAKRVEEIIRGITSKVMEGVENG